MWNVIEETKTRFSPALAQKLLLYNNHPDQRTLKTPKLNRYANKMREGLWLPTANVSLAMINGTTFMANGQHFLNSIIQTGITQNGTLIRVTTDNEGFSKLYRQFDSRDQARTMEDYVRIEINALDVEWKPRTASLIARALAFITDQIKLTESDQVDLLRPHSKEAAFVSYIVDKISPSPKHMTKKPIIIPMILTWQKCQKDAIEFWQQVRDGENLSSQMPSYRLREWLRTLVLRGNAITKATTTEKEVIVRCILCWNAFRKNRKIKTLPRYVIDRPIPKAI